MPRATQPKQLVIPKDALDDPEAAEVLRAWLAHGDLHCSLKPTIWPDPGSWGVLLADVARHVALAVHKRGGADPADTLERIRDAFDAAMDDVSASPEGGFDESE
jgi:hypothetical protein